MQYDTYTKKHFIASYAACEKRAFRGLSDNGHKFKCISHTDIFIYQACVAYNKR